MHPMDYDEPRFLEPAHSHDPIQVSHFINIPTSITENIPSSFQEALIVLQESTSVAFASSKRLQTLAADRLHRLVPAMAELSSIPVNEAGDIKYSEPAFSTYASQVQAEKRYLLEEALPDWRHKAARVLGDRRQCETKVACHGKNEAQVDFETWWTELRKEVDKLFEEAEDMELPDFEDTVAEVRIFQDKEIKKSIAREGRYRRISTSELDLFKPKIRDRAETLDSGIGMSYASETEDWDFAI